MSGLAGVYIYKLQYCFTWRQAMKRVSAITMFSLIFLISAVGGLAGTMGNYGKNFSAEDQTAITKALNHFENNKDKNKINNPAEELETDRVDLDNIGMRHVRFDQYYQGIKVRGAVMIAHLTSDGAVKSSNGSYVSSIKLDITPSLSAENAAEKAVELHRAESGVPVSGETELIIVPLKGEVFLCWQVSVSTTGPFGLYHYFIDAHNGELVHRVSRIVNANDIGTGYGVFGNYQGHIDLNYNSGNYDMIDYTRQAANNPHGHNGAMPAGNDIHTNVAGATLPGVISTDTDTICKTASMIWVRPCR